MKEYGNQTLRVNYYTSSFIAISHFYYICYWIMLDSGRTMVCQYYFVQSADVQETLSVYDTIRDLNTVR